MSINGGCFCSSKQNRGTEASPAPLQHVRDTPVKYASPSSLSENTPERTAGAAEGRGHAAGQPLRHGHDQGLCREGGLALAAAHAQDGRPPQARERVRRLLQNVRAGGREVLVLDLQMTYYFEPNFTGQLNH